MTGPWLRGLLWSGRRALPPSTAASLLLSTHHLLPRYFSSAPSPSASQASAGTVTDPKLLRNVAVIAHVDHGRTILMDRIIRQCGADVPRKRALDSISLERERGITISSNVTSISWKEHVLNIVDTPGHADFGGEVERVVEMVEGAVLVVDAGEGPLAQTKFVLDKALKYGLRPILLLNKVDRPSVSEETCNEIKSSVFDLFTNLGAKEEQLEFPVLYASAKEGWASLTFTKSPNDDERTMAPLLDAILEYVPSPSAKQMERGKKEIGQLPLSRSNLSYSWEEKPKPATSFHQSFARSNSSFFSCNGKAFLSSVLRLRSKEKMFLLDAGVGTPITCLQNELARVPINRATRFENRVGSLNVRDSVADESLILPRKFRQNRVWVELKKIWRTNKKVKGFRIDKVRGGYTVAIAGYISFLPFSTFFKKKMRKDVRFNIARIQPKPKRIVLI